MEEGSYYVSGSGRWARSVPLASVGDVESELKELVT